MDHAEMAVTELASSAAMGWALRHRRFPRWRQWLAGLCLPFCLPIWLGGCAIDDDPHQGGFASGVVGLAGGGYQRRVDEREGVYRGELSAQEQLKAQAHELERARAAVRTDLDRARARLAAQENRIRRERALLAAQGQRTPAARTRVERLDQAQSRIVRTQGQLGSIRPEAQSLEDLKQRSRGLENELNEIDGLVGTVSGQAF
ncbi:hypothetical protein Thivi_3431 [Thiocystis violascens DSM 198]|uniref:Lipoprotein n=2 Tax=Thiocystis violascens TaxID=73141 RepID=I3YE83_THIV6|nr:hypothetical protein Thivi_3431 [Thiocystis violascens DSM 198]